MRSYKSRHRDMELSLEDKIDLKRVSLLGLYLGDEQDEREVGYSPRGEEAPSGAPTGKKGHRERLTMAETRLDVLEASMEELYQGQGRLLGVESSQEEAESRIEKVESLIDQLTKDTKDFVRHLHEVVAELTAKLPARLAQLTAWTIDSVATTAALYAHAAQCSAATCRSDSTQRDCYVCTAIIQDHISKTSHRS
ncbi:hypothetical protein BHM03_00049269 [Ensete ventricosum]|nr:hypothetical protein BHM03_00049269 [Ensete ventricosum]